MAAGHGGKDFSQPKLGWVNLDRGFAQGAQNRGLALGLWRKKPSPKAGVWRLRASREEAQPKRLVFVLAVPSRRLANGCGPSVAEGCRPSDRNKSGRGLMLLAAQGGCYAPNPDPLSFPFFFSIPLGF